MLCLFDWKRTAEREFRDKCNRTWRLMNCCYFGKCDRVVQRENLVSSDRRRCPRWWPMASLIVSRNVTIVEREIVSENWKEHANCNNVLVWSTRDQRRRFPEPSTDRTKQSKRETKRNSNDREEKTNVVSKEEKERSIIANRPIVQFVESLHRLTKCSKAKNLRSTNWSSNVERWTSRPGDGVGTGEERTQWSKENPFSLGNRLGRRPLRHDPLQSSWTLDRTIPSVVALRKKIRASIVN